LAARRRAEKPEISRKAATLRSTKEAAATLGVAPDASAEQIRTAYMRLARLYHPDMATGASTAFRISGNAKMQEINAAYRELMGRD
jgi:curved DNA-binding protein CbpA